MKIVWSGKKGPSGRARPSKKRVLRCFVPKKLPTKSYPKILPRVTPKLAQTTAKRPHQQNRGAALRAAQPSVFASLFAVVCANFGVTLGRILGVLLASNGVTLSVKNSNSMFWKSRVPKRVLLGFVCSLRLRRFVLGEESCLRHPK